MAVHDQNLAQKENTDRRYLPRWTMRSRILWKKGTSTQTRSANIKNLSCAGVCVTAETVFAPNEAVHLMIDVPWDNPIRVDGIVCWVNKDKKDGQMTAGIHFMNMDNAVQDALLHYLAESEHTNLADVWFKEWK